MNRCMKKIIGQTKNKITLLELDLKNKGYRFRVDKSN